MIDEDVLVADIGGTNARLAVARVLNGGAVTLQHIEVQKSAGHARIADLIAGYGTRLGALPGQACLAIAGPISGGVGRVTNAGLTADAEELRRELGFARVLVMNDFAALANAVPQLAPGEVSIVKDGEAKAGEPISVIGAGTGFGCALLPPCGGRYGLVATEGGHASFSPTDEVELRLWQWLRQHMGHVSVETVLSGPGLALLHRALREFEGVKESLSPNEICRAAAEDPGSPAARTLERFCNIFGGVAGDIVLTQGAAGGAYLGGGVLMKNSAALLRSRFVERFTAKGVMASYLVKVPVFLIRSEYAALKGAALWAAAHAAAE
jgi:glucokinase